MSPSSDVRCRPQVADHWMGGSPGRFPPLSERHLHAPDDAAAHDLVDGREGTERDLRDGLSAGRLRRRAAAGDLPVRPTMIRPTMPACS